MIKTLQENKNGRDFVIGDLHGALDLLKQFMQHVNFDPFKDRIISVGDLIDRGPKSLECLQLIENPWFHSVKANHEQMLEDYITGGPTGRWWHRNGGQWFFDLNKEGKDSVIAMLPKIQNLPWIITVEGLKKFHVIHAELFVVHGELITDLDLANEATFKKLALTFSEDGESCIWGRNLFGPFFATSIDQNIGKAIRGIELRKSADFFNPELSHIFSGHTPMQRPTRIKGQTNIDTFAVNVGIKPWCGLTVVEPATDTFWLVNDDIKQVDSLILK